MKKSTISQPIRTLKKWHEVQHSLNMKHPIQRSSGQWSALNQSLLIDSVLNDYIIPPLYFDKRKGEDGSNVYYVVDGQQRLSVLFNYINDGFELHSKIPSVEIDGVTYEVAGKKYSDQAEDVQKAIQDGFFTIYQLEDTTNEELEEVFLRLNSGVALSKVQLARPKMGTEMSVFTNELVETNFFQKSLNLSVASLRREDDLFVLLQTMMLMDMDAGNYTIRTMVSAAEAAKYAEYIRDNYEDKKENLKDLVEYLNEGFKDENIKYLKKNNICVICFIANKVKEYIYADEFKAFVDEFFESGATDDYNEASGSGNNKLPKVQTRINEMFGMLKERFSEDLAECDISEDFLLKKSRNDGVQKNSSSEASTEEQNPEDVSENAEVENASSEIPADSDSEEAEGADSEEDEDANTISTTEASGEESTEAPEEAEVSGEQGNK